MKTLAKVVSDARISWVLNPVLWLTNVNSWKEVVSPKLAGWVRTTGCGEDGTLQAWRLIILYPG